MKAGIDGVLVNDPVLALGARGENTPMNLRFVTTKVLRSAITLWMVVTFIFIVLRLSGDPIDMLLPDDADAEMINYYMKEWGLDRPLHEQYWRYFVAIFQGDFGVSFVDDRKALDVVVERIPATLQLGSAAFTFSICLGLPLGIVAALNRNTMVDRGVMTMAVLGYAIPNFFLGILLILTFSLWLQWLPSSGSDTFWHMVMPVVTLGTAGMGALARFTRSAMLGSPERAVYADIPGQGIAKGKPHRPPCPPQCGHSRRDHSWVQDRRIDQRIADHRIDLCLAGSGPASGDVCGATRPRGGAGPGHACRPHHGDRQFAD